MAITDPEACALARLFYEAGHLKRSKRTGWWVAGITDPETVAEHSWRTAVIAYFIALAEGADPERAATIGVFHDMPETRTGDIEYVGRNYLTVKSDETIATDQAQHLPSALADGFLGVISQAADRSSPESICVRDADKLECLLQALEYQKQGHQDVQAWVDNMVAAVRTTTGRALAEAALHTDPAEWWREIAALHVTAAGIRRAG